MTEAEEKLKYPRNFNPISGSRISEISMKFTLPYPGHRITGIWKSEENLYKVFSAMHYDKVGEIMTPDLHDGIMQIQLKVEALTPDSSSLESKNDERSK